MLLVAYRQLAHPTITHLDYGYNTPMSPALPLDEILVGDSLQLLADLPAESVDVVFADPPYNLQLRGDLWRPNLSKVDAVNDDWDHFADFAAYDAFTRDWLAGCRRVLKRTGTLWVIGTYHNIHRIGALMQDMSFWLLNEIVWIKVNPMPNFRGVRFTNAHEILLWAQKERGESYTFNHHALKSLNDGLQMRSDWTIPLCTGRERLRHEGAKAHPTQKPEALLYRVLMASTRPGDVVLDPFFGTGTTGAVAKKLGRHYIGMERNQTYARLAQARIDAVETVATASALDIPDRRQARLPFGALLEAGFLHPGDVLTFGADGVDAMVTSDGQLTRDGQTGSIHQMARALHPGPCNGWQLWYYLDTKTGTRQPIDVLRQKIRAQHSISPEDTP